MRESYEYDVCVYWDIEYISSQVDETKVESDSRRHSGVKHDSRACATCLAYMCNIRLMRMWDVTHSYRAEWVSRCCLHVCEKSLMCAMWLTHMYDTWTTHHVNEWVISYEWVISSCVVHIAAKEPCIWLTHMYDTWPTHHVQQDSLICAIWLTHMYDTWPTHPCNMDSLICTTHVYI